MLLNRAHYPTSSIAIVACMALDLIVGSPVTTYLTYTALLIGGPSSAVAIGGSVAHSLWGRGRIWNDLECEPCRPGPDDGDDDEPEPDDPAGGGGLALDRLCDQHVLAA
ncbi:hypothetical protein GCM10010274_46670 [Streptomyces lavendofoliae]|uniref:Uncharacterized protein n=1 Tax=Streptomyces lavendofoliae TaxID=67314 RepID=A0A918I112_9ACTN|nr:hypothetical protein GCM10010274_46670 [Streptomyces lavendofoliae]